MRIRIAGSAWAEASAHIDFCEDSATTKCWRKIWLMHVRLRQRERERAPTSTYVCHTNGQQIGRKSLTDVTESDAALSLLLMFAN